MNPNAPQVRYHPSIQMPGPVAASKPKWVQKKTCGLDHHTRSDLVGPVQHQPRLRSFSDPGPDTTNPTPAQILPMVRYHPSIQMPGPVAATKTEWVHKNVARPDRPLGPVQHKPRPRSFIDPGDGKVLTGPSTADSDPTTRLVLPDMKLDRRQVEEVEVQTRGQRTNQAWFSWRKNRITASCAHNIAHCGFVNGKTEMPPATYLAAITGDRTSRPTLAMKWGIEREDQVIQMYQESRPSVLVQACGLFIDPQRPWLAASPDGIVTDRQTGDRLRCLEVKCPYKHRDRPVDDACRQDRDFCLEMLDDQSPEEPPAFRLKRSHSYFTQVQCQLAVTGLQNADFVVYTTVDLVVVPVTFDPDFWEQTVSRLEMFYRQAVLPHLSRRALQAAEV